MKVLVTLMLLFFSSGGLSSANACSYQDIVDHLNLTVDNSRFTTTRPVLNHTHITQVELDIYLYSVVSVNEKSQIFTPFIWTSIIWNDERISWEPSDFCGITSMAIPKELLWRPDLIIYEMTEKVSSPVNPYIMVSHKGYVKSENEMRVVSICKMDIHQFPFDTQRCVLTLSSAMHTSDELHLFTHTNTSIATQQSHKVMLSQGEWEFLELSVARGHLSFKNKVWEQLVYTFTIKRRPLLHVVNLLLPVFFFLLLDLASFLISDLGGEKLGFKVTVLLAISVLLLILNDILPSSSNTTPLIATYCIVIFGLMLLSLLETILVVHLLARASAAAEKKKGANEDKLDVNAVSCKSGEKQQTSSEHVEVPPNELRPVLEEAQVLLLILEEVRGMQRTLGQALCRNDGGGEYEKWILKFHRGFSLCYVLAVVIFLSYMWKAWIAHF